MAKAPEVLAIIPARGGSKGVPSKNTRLLCGKPLIAYTVEEALKSRHISRTIVSTDSADIARVARKCRAEVPFLRPAELAQDDTPMLPVVKHAVSFMEANGYHPEIVVLLQPTSPLREARHIDQAVDKLMETGADCVVSICPEKHPPQWLFTLADGVLKPLFDEKIELRQQSQGVYRLNGAVYVMKRDAVMQAEAILSGDTRAIVMPPEASVDIDTELDFKLAEALLQQKRR